MWAKLDDALLDHRKLLEAGRAFGRDGKAKALGLYAAGLLYSNKHLTDGVLAKTVVEEVLKSFVDRPLDAARVMVKVGLWEVTEDGFRVHDFHDHNLSAKDVQAKRQADRDRKKKSNGRA
jgi:hypothetical protein